MPRGSHQQPANSGAPDISSPASDYLSAPSSPESGDTLVATNVQHEEDLVTSNPPSTTGNGAENQTSVTPLPSPVPRFPCSPCVRRIGRNSEHECFPSRRKRCVTCAGINHTSPDVPEHAVPAVREYLAARERLRSEEITHREFRKIYKQTKDILGSPAPPAAPANPSVNDGVNEDSARSGAGNVPGEILFELRAIHLLLESYLAPE